MIKICMTCKHRPIMYKNHVEAPNLVEPLFWDSGDYTCPFLCDDSYYNKMPDDDFYCGYWEGKQDETN